MPAEVEIRPYEPQDKAGFADLVGTVLAEYGFTVDPVLESDLENPPGSYDAIWVAVHEVQIIGSVAMRLPKDGKAAELKRMYLRPPFRGRGLGRSLLDQALRWAETQGCESVVLDTSAAMAEAQRLYETAGFRRTGTRTETGAHDSRCEILYRLELRSQT